MTFRNFSRSFIAVTSLLTVSLPAYANPFQIQGASSVFRNPVLTAPVTPGSIPTGNAAGAVNRPSRPTPTSNPIGNQEIQGLGDHESWIDTGVLAEDPRALCSDIGLGNNTTSSSSTVAMNTQNRQSSSSAQSHRDGGGGGVSILGIGVSGSGSSQGSRNQTQSRDERLSRNESRNSSTSTVETGRNCDAFVQSAAARDMNYEDNLTERYRIRVDRRGNQVDNLLAPR